jgi:DNA-binding XRE family transcriptional regulator/molybdate-binding protein
MNDELRRARVEAGLSQADLARAAGLSRQLVGAVESGRHSPSVAAAIALAEVVGRSVEELFAGAPRVQQPALGTVPEGAPVVATLVGDTLSYGALPERGAGAASWSRADGIFAEGRVVLFGDVSTGGFLVSGCDPALGLAAAMGPRTGPRRIIALHGSSDRSLEALEGGRIHAALVHGTRRPRREGITIARWEVGIASRPGQGVDLGRIADGSQSIARRERGAAAQKAVDRALANYSKSPSITGPVAGGHIDAARRVAFGGVDAAVTMRPAAETFGLDFLALEEHLVELVVDDGWRDHPGAAALIDILSSRAFRERLDPFPGYQLSTS